MRGTTPLSLELIRHTKRVLEWLRQSKSVPLYLTGDSGSGKTSLLKAFVIPAFRKEGWTVAVVRAGQDAEAALKDALTVPRRQRVSTTRELIEAGARRCQDRLLIVLDQFEEFLILGAPEPQRTLAATIADLSEHPIRGVKILLVVRSDYQTVLDEVGLPRLMQGENFFQVGRFREEAARRFFKSSKLDLKDGPLVELLKSAAELDDTPGMIRPITLNVLGYVLRQQRGALASSLDAGTVVRGYIAQTVENPATRVWAPPVLEGLLTEQGTKRPRREAELAADAKLRPAEVRAVLHALAGAALARPLEASQGVWELSHDFVARALNRYLGRRRAALLRRAGAYAAPALLTLGVVTGLAALEWHHLAPGQVKAELADLGIAIETHKQGLFARTTDTFDPEKLAAVVPLLRTLSVVGLDLHNTQVANLEPLKGLTALQQLNLADTPVANLDPLKELTALQQLDLSKFLSDLANLDLEPLKGLTALQQLNLGSAPVANLEPLKGLTALQRLDLANTKVTDLEPLKGLTALQQLNLAVTKVANLEPLKGLTALQQLDLAYTQVTNLEPLKGLTALQRLDLSTAQAVIDYVQQPKGPVANLEPLKELIALQQLNLFNTQVTNLEPLKGLTALQQLNLADTEVTNLEPLNSLTALQQLNLGDTQVTNVEPLKGLMALQQLYLANTPIAELEPLKGLTALQQLYLVNTPVANLEPLKGLPALQQLYVASTKVTATELERVREYRYQNGLPSIQVEK